MDNKKKLTAAIAAVSMYIQSEEEALVMAAPAAPAEAAPPIPPAPFKAWAMSGRQAQMQMHSMMLMKAYHGFTGR